MMPEEKEAHRIAALVVVLLLWLVWTSVATAATSPALTGNGPRVGNPGNLGFGFRLDKVGYNQATGNVVWHLTSSASTSEGSTHGVIATRALIDLGGAGHTMNAGDTYEIGTFYATFTVVFQTNDVSWGAATSQIGQSSDYSTFTVSNAAPKKATFRTQRANVDATWTVTDSHGNVVKQVFVKAGDLWTGEVDNPDGEDLQYTASYDNGDGTVTVLAAGTLLAAAMDVKTTDSPASTGPATTVANVPTQPDDSRISNQVAQTSDTQTRYIVQPSVVVGTTINDAATNGTIIKGANVVAAAIGGLEDSIRSGLQNIKGDVSVVTGTGGGGGGGGTGSVTVTVDNSGVIAAVNGVGSKLDTSNAHLQALRNYADAVEALKDGNPTQAAWSSGGAAAGAGFVDLVGGVPSAASSLPSGEAFADAFKIAIPFGGSAAVVNVNPLSNESMAAVVAWFRAATGWAVLLALARYMWGYIFEFVVGASAANQAKGNALAWGTGEQATAMIAAGALTVAVTTGVTALLSWAFSGLSAGMITSLAASSVMDGMPGVALGFLNAVFPVSTIVTAALTRAVFPMYAASIYGAMASAIRFVVP